MPKSKRMHRIKFADGTTTTMNVKNKSGSKIGTADAWKYAEEIYNKIVVEIETW